MKTIDVGEIPMYGGEKKFGEMEQHELYYRKEESGYTVGDREYMDGYGSIHGIVRFKVSSVVWDGEESVRLRVQEILNKTFGVE